MSDAVTALCFMLLSMVQFVTGTDDIASMGCVALVDEIIVAVDFISHGAFADGMHHDKVLTY